MVFNYFVDGKCIFKTLLISLSLGNIENELEMDLI